jgi:hypothetical protein
MEYSREDFETLRLLRAFGKIQDPQKRREIIELVESKAAAPKKILMTSNPTRRVDRTMRKVVSHLDDAQRQALLEWADFGTVVFSAGLVVEVLRGLVSLVT